MMTKKEKSEKLQNGIVYLKNDFEGIALMSTPGRDGKFFAKHAKEQPYEIHHSTDLVIETLFEWDEITKEQYDSF